MKIRSFLRFALLVVCVTFIYLIFSGEGNEGISAGQTTRSKSSAGALPTKEKSASQKNSSSEHFIAYYFHATRRCPTCLKIEASTGEALKEKFAEELKVGKLEWRSVNVTLPENKHFVDEYQLVSQSVVLSAVQGGKETKWKKLDKVWQLIRNKEAFFSYIQTETRDFLNENKS